MMFHTPRIGTPFVPLKFIALLLLCQLFGEVFVVWTGLPVPGPVVGMVLLFGGLALHGGVPDGLGRVVDSLVSHLSLLFVPAGVGVMLHITMLREEWLAISVALVLSTVLTIAATGVLMVMLIRWIENRRRED
jgi:holin-like protein